MTGRLLSINTVQHLQHCDAAKSKVHHELYHIRKHSKLCPKFRYQFKITCFISVINGQTLNLLHFSIENEIAIYLAEIRSVDANWRQRTTDLNHEIQID